MRQRIINLDSGKTSLHTAHRRMTTMIRGLITDVLRALMLRLSNTVNLLLSIMQATAKAMVETVTIPRATKITTHPLTTMLMTTAIQVLVDTISNNLQEVTPVEATRMAVLLTAEEVHRAALALEPLTKVLPLVITVGPLNNTVDLLKRILTNKATTMMLHPMAAVLLLMEVVTVEEVIKASSD
jgi:hypothetical protein